MCILRTTEIQRLTCCHTFFFSLYFTVNSNNTDNFSGHETGEGGGRSRRSLASVGGDIAHFEDAAGDKFQHPPNITPVGGVPNLKVD